MCRDYIRNHQGRLFTSVKGTHSKNSIMFCLATNLIVEFLFYIKNNAQNRTRKRDLYDNTKNF